MPAYLKIENPGVAPVESFTLLGATTKTGSDKSIGKFGSGAKHFVAVCLRNEASPIVYAGSLCMEFGTKNQTVNDGNKDHHFPRVFVKYGGKDENGVNRSSTEDLGFVLGYGSNDWDGIELALREVVSNAIDRAVEENDLHEKSKTPWDKVVIEIVNENQVRAKAGHTRVFVPLTSEALDFYNNLGKWFLHFSEPELLDKTILPKNHRNLQDRTAAVIYRRGVRVREFESDECPSLFDYNLENLPLDESRKVDDYAISSYAAIALADGDEVTIGKLFQSFVDGVQYWEHGFNNYNLNYWGADQSKQKQVWQAAFDKVAGENAIVAVPGGGDIAKCKGYKVVELPQEYVKAASGHGVRTADVVLSADERQGREILDSTADSLAALDFVWGIIEKYKLTNGKKRPEVKTFRKVMEFGGQTLGFYRDGVVYINQDIASSGSVLSGWHHLTQQLLVTMLEECVHHCAEAKDFVRDFQDYVLNLAIYMGREINGLGNDKAGVG